MRQGTADVRIDQIKGLGFSWRRRRVRDRDLFAVMAMLTELMIREG